MTIIRPVSPDELALRDKVRETVKKANLNLSETEALNWKYDLHLKYTPKKDVVELTTYANKTKPSDFTLECMEAAAKFGKTIKHNIVPSDKSDFQENLANAIKKLKKIKKYFK